MAGRTMFGLDFADLLGAAGTGIQEAQQLGIDAVDFGADAGQGLGKSVTHAGSSLALGEIVHEGH